MAKQQVTSENNLTNYACCVNPTPLQSALPGTAKIILLESLDDIVVDGSRVLNNAYSARSNCYYWPLVNQGKTHSRFRKYACPLKRLCEGSPIYWQASF
ncbi:hypothetical protein MITS9504_01270 [Synechococcus sp. MIT S9504]|nr:hypothetical protein MITS9504_01270 [Synechococcus sp. MIT S9504]